MKAALAALALMTGSTGIAQTQVDLWGAWRDTGMDVLVYGLDVEVPLTPEWDFTTGLESSRATDFSAVVMVDGEPVDYSGRQVDFAQGLGYLGLRYGFPEAALHVAGVYETREFSEMGPYGRRRIDRCRGAGYQASGVFRAPEHWWFQPELVIGYRALNGREGVFGWVQAGLAAPTDTWGVYVGGGVWHEFREPEIQIATGLRFRF